jgi:hypothetical protein
MKKIFLQFIIAISFLSGIMAQDFGKVVIRNGANTNPKFIASLNGIRLNNDYNTTVSFNYLDEQKYRIKILQAGSTQVLSFVLASEPNYISKYILNKDNYGNYSLILESKSLLVSEDVVTTPTTVVNIPTNTVVVVPVATVATTYTYSCMTPEDFGNRLSAIKKESFDKDKLVRCKDVFADEYFSSQQVSDVMKTFSFEDHKVSFAKWAYKNTIDKKNFYKVNDNLSFSSSKNELSKFIREQPKD